MWRFSGIQELKKGSRGSTVVDLQTALNLQLVPSPKLTADGIFGKKTELAVKAFQSDNGLSPSGTVGPEVWAKLKRPLIKPGASGPDVKFLQQSLIRIPWTSSGVTVNEEFDAETEAAVRAFQKNAGLTVDGDVGPNTWSALIAAPSFKVGRKGFDQRNPGVVI